MDFSESILKTIRRAVGLNDDDTSFDSELKIFINMSIVKLNQNGVGKNIVVVQDETWDDFKDPNQTVGNEAFSMIPSFVMIDVKMLFDPPPPSSLEYQSSCRDEILWRLRSQYESEVFSNE